MQLIKSIVRPDKVDDVKDALARLGRVRHDRDRGARTRAAERAHRDLSRQGIPGHAAPQDAGRDASSRTTCVEPAIEAVVKAARDRRESATAGCS